PAAAVLSSVRRHPEQIGDALLERAFAPLAPGLQLPPQVIDGDNGYSAGAQHGCEHLQSSDEGRPERVGWLFQSNLAHRQAAGKSVRITILDWMLELHTLVLGRWLPP